MLNFNLNIRAMKGKTFNVNFFAKLARTHKDGSVPVYARI